jgi:hypothetical protein
MRGDWLSVERPGAATYWHHAIDTGTGTVIHFSGEPARKSEASVCESPFGDFATAVDNVRLVASPWSEDAHNEAAGLPSPAAIFREKNAEAIKRAQAVGDFALAARLSGHVYIPSFAARFNVRVKLWRPPFEMALDAEQIIERAFSRRGETGYSLIVRNCEHFASWAATGTWESEQVQTAVAVAGLASAAAVGGAVLLKFGSELVAGARVFSPFWHLWLLSDEKPKKTKNEKPPAARYNFKPSHIRMALDAEQKRYVRSKDHP